MSWRETWWHTDVVLEEGDSREFYMGIGRQQKRQ